MTRTDGVQGKVWLLQDASGAWWDRLSPDQIYDGGGPFFPGTPAPLSRDAVFRTLPGWEHFHQQARAGDVLVTGEEFGTGPIFPQAVLCFKTLGISLILGKSFSRDYYREAVNHGLAIMTASRMTGQTFATGQEVAADFTSGRIICVRTQQDLCQAEPWSAVQLAIYRAGSLSAYAQQVLNRSRQAAPTM